MTQFAIHTSLGPGDLKSYEIYYNIDNNPAVLGFAVCQSVGSNEPGAQAYGGVIMFDDLAEAERVRDEYEAGMHRPFYIMSAFHEKDARGKTWVR